MDNPLFQLTNDELIRSLKALAKEERGRTVAVLKHLREMDRRRLAEENWFPSLFEYCVRELRYGHAAAGRRIQAARAAAKFKVLYRILERGLLSVSTVSLLAPHLTWSNHRKLIRAASGKSAREVEALIASLTTAPPPAERIRFIGSAPPSNPAPAAPDLFHSTSASTAEAPALSEREALAPPEFAPPKALRVQFSFTANERLMREVERAKELLRHQIPAGRLEDLFEAAISALLDKIDPERRIHRRTIRTAAARTRRISPALRETVWRRDGGRCVYRSSDGRVCGARARLQIDHVVPRARGGSSDDARNLRLLCRAHNLLEARRVFGDAAIDAAAAGRSS